MSWRIADYPVSERKQDLIARLWGGLKDGGTSLVAVSFIKKSFYAEGGISYELQNFFEQSS